MQLSFADPGSLTGLYHPNYDANYCALDDN